MQPELEFNKDIAFLMELQRLESSANDYKTLRKPDIRLSILECWASAIAPNIKKKLPKYYNTLKKRIKEAQPIINPKYRNRLINMYDEGMIQELHNFLNKMNFLLGFQMRAKKSGAESLFG